MFRFLHRCWGFELRSSYFQNKYLPNPQSEAIFCLLVYLKIKCQKTAKAFDQWFYTLVGPITKNTVVKDFPSSTCQSLLVFAYSFLIDFIAIIWLLFISISAHTEVLQICLHNQTAFTSRWSPLTTFSCTISTFHPQAKHLPFAGRYTGFKPYWKFDGNSVS